jgi:hypothetical protein
MGRLSVTCDPTDDTNAGEDETMTIDDVLTQLDALAEKVRSIGDSDPEVAHSNEDDLMAWALQLIAVNVMAGSIADAQRLALAGLATRQLKFRRWYA